MFESIVFLCAVGRMHGSLRDKLCTDNGQFWLRMQYANVCKFLLDGSNKILIVICKLIC